MPIDTELSNSTTLLWKEMGWEPTQKQFHQLSQLQVLLKKWNEKSNLTRLSAGDDYWISQVFDSLWPFKQELDSLKKNNPEFIDVGSGCGFPGIAIAIAMPGAQVTLLDSSRKKTDALKAITKELGLESRVRVIKERVEITGRNSLFRQNYDFALARALDQASVVAEYLIPLVHLQGEAVLYKGTMSNKEKEALKKSLIYLNATFKQSQKIELPKNRGMREIIRLSPNGKCPNKYPRAIGQPSKKPLGS